MASIYIYLGRHSLLIDLKNGSMMYKAPVCATGTVYHTFFFFIPHGPSVEGRKIEWLEHVSSLKNNKTHGYLISREW